jgi:D-glycero-D-manno-heptose 1,7-bisphosphate phosphatase
MQRLVSEQGGNICKIYVCPHGPGSDCQCRKPKPGLLQAFAEDFHVNLQDVFFIGDALRDIEAAVTAGAKPILVKTGKGLQTQQDNPDLNVPVFENLYDAARYITSRY